LPKTNRSQLPWTAPDARIRHWPDQTSEVSNQ
jgi:hypothetical protein